MDAGSTEFLVVEISQGDGWKLKLLATGPVDKAAVMATLGTKVRLVVVDDFDGTLDKSL